MTENQKFKFLRSEAFRKAASLSRYPYGFEDGSEEASLMDAAISRTRLEWKAIYDAANGEDWNANKENLARFHKVCGAEENADQTVREKVFENGSLDYYRCCIASCE